jgi:microcystin-dependent protein
LLKILGSTYGDDGMMTFALREFTPTSLIATC